MMNGSKLNAMTEACRTLESVATYTRGGGPPVPDHDSNFSSRKRRVAVEQRRLIEWARKNGKLSFAGRLPPVLIHGGEHEVFIQKGSQGYLKATRLDRFMGYGFAVGLRTSGATPSEYLERCLLQKEGSPSSSSHNQPSKGVFRPKIRWTS